MDRRDWRGVLRAVAPTIAVLGVLMAYNFWLARWHGVPALYHLPSSNLKQVLSDRGVLAIGVVVANSAVALFYVGLFTLPFSLATLENDNVSISAGSRRLAALTAGIAFAGYCLVCVTEFGGLPFIASGEKPTRRDGLIYYRRAAEHFGLDIRPGEEAIGVTREADGRFLVSVRRAHDARAYRAANVVFATGYYDNPNFLGIPGEDLPHVSHYFLEGHPFWHRDVIVIGAGNSSVDAAPPPAIAMSP